MYMQLLYVQPHLSSYLKYKMTQNCDSEKDKICLRQNKMFIYLIHLNKCFINLEICQTGLQLYSIKIITYYKNKTLSD